MLISEQELFLDELNSIRDRTDKSYDIKTISPLIYEFTERVISSPLTKHPLDDLKKEMAIDCDPLNKTVKNLASRIWPALEDGIIYSEKNSLKNQPVDNLIRFNSRELTANNLCIQYCMFSKFIKSLWDDDPVKHRNFIEKYASIDETNQANPVKLNFNLDDLEKELKSLDRIKKTKAWYSLVQLINFNLIYNPKLYEKYKTEFKEKFPILQMQTDIRFNALDRALSPTTHPAAYEIGLNQNDCKDHMRRIYHYIRRGIMPTKSVADSSNSSAETTEPGVKIHAYDYDSVTAELKIDNDNPIKYQKGEKPAQVLKDLTSNKHKRLSYIYIYNAHIQDPNEPKVKDLSRKEKKQVESVIRQINKRLPDSRPKFIVEQTDLNNLNNRIAMISSSYKSSKS